MQNLSTCAVSILPTGNVPRTYIHLHVVSIPILLHSNTNAVVCISFHTIMGFLIMVIIR